MIWLVLGPVIVVVFVFALFHRPKEVVNESFSADLQKEQPVRQ
jgi:hypothetical protein